MKKLIIIALIVFALFKIGEKNENASTPSDYNDVDASSNEVNKIEYFFSEAYDGLTVCAAKCREIASSVLS